MLVARARSRLVKLILPIASTIGRASKLVMSICSTVVDSNSALRTSLVGASGCETVLSHSPPPRWREGPGVGARPIAGDVWKSAVEGKRVPSTADPVGGRILTKKHE